MKTPANKAESMGDVKLTKAQRRWLLKMTATPEGEISWPRPNYDMAGRMRDAGLVEIIDPPGSVRWPWGVSWFLRITPTGRALLKDTPNG